MGMLISVIMPTYNSAEYIEEAIESVINQTFKTLELIVIDDASRDNTEAIVKEMIKKDERIHYYINKKNEGVSYARNRGISLARGKWIAFLDSDDIWEPDKVEKQLKLLEKEPKAVLLYTGTAFVNRLGAKSKYILEVPEKISYAQLLKQNIISCSSVLVLKSVIERIKMQNDSMHEDFAVWLRILSKISYAYGINEPLINYRMTGNSKSSNKLKAAKMTYNVYKSIGLSDMQACYFMCFYAFRNIKKYFKIKRYS